MHQRPPTLTPEELAAITAGTLANYDGAAERFWEGTRDHDVSQNVAALLEHIEGTPPTPSWTSGVDRDASTHRAPRQHKRRTQIELGSLENTVTPEPSRRRCAKWRLMRADAAAVVEAADDRA